MPRRYASYEPEFETLHAWSTYGSWILSLGLFLALFSWLYGLKSREPVGDNPWGAVSLEWATASPPIEHNFHETPHVARGPYDFPEIDPSMAPKGH